MTHSPAILLGMIKKEKDRRACESSLMAFVRSSWDIIEPGVEFRENWHLNAIAEHLEAVSRDEIQNLVIAIPPGCMKSILVSVAFPAWEWIKRPELRYLGASYGIDLAIRDSMKCRDIIMSDWYRNNWGDKVEIKHGEDQKIKYALTAGGWRMATSVGGRGTGEHPDRKLVDDPHNAKQAESDAERETAIAWFDRTLSSRGKSRKAKTIVVAQRFHENDLTGHILADIPGYTYLGIPMEYDRNSRKTSIGWTDPRTEEGELLWRDMFDEESVKELKINLGAYGTSGQLQQDPNPGDGGILKTQFIQLWPHDRAIPRFEYILQSYDCAFKEKASNDPTASTVWAIVTHEGKRGMLLIDAWDERLGYPAMRQKVVDSWDLEYGGMSARSPFNRPKRADRVLVEDKASGQSLIQDLRLANVPVASYNPGNADKVSRANLAAPTLEMGAVWVLESGKTPGHPVSWAIAFIKQLSKFPVAKHDDYVDTFTQAVIYFKNNRFFDLPKAKDIDDEKPQRKQEYVNPYAA